LFGRIDLKLVLLQMKVSVMTPTCNRKDRFELAVYCMKNQTYTDPIEWVIVEDGDDDVSPLLTDLPSHIEPKYIRLEGKHTIGYKRNICLKEATGDILLFHDDDDYYQPEHIGHVVFLLCSQSSYGVVGSSTLVVYSTKKKSFYISGQFGKNDSPCGVLGFTRNALKQYRMKFRDTDTHAEETYFLRDFRIPILHCDPKKTIVAIQHGFNTWNVEFDEAKKIEWKLPQEVYDLLDK
jgi:glycosyltransferase involved in cell wall biosynthesis